MAKLRRDIGELKVARDIKRQERRRNSIPSVAIAGYTNAGKSSLLNRLTDAGVLVQNALFATLDPTVRKAETNDGRIYTLTDTVGFVRHLPHELIDAFKSTLEEVSNADLIVHVVDGANSDPLGQISAVREVIREIGGKEIPEIIALNKVEIADQENIRAVLREEPNAHLISVHTGAGIRELIKAIESNLPRPKIEVAVLIPFNRGELLNRVHESGEVISIEHTNLGTEVIARVDGALAAKLAIYSKR
jgi:GTP-binding protein HflX